MTTPDHPNPEDAVPGTPASGYPAAGNSAFGESAPGNSALGGFGQPAPDPNSPLTPPPVGPAMQAGIPNSPNSYAPYGPYAPQGQYGPQGQYPPGPPPQPGWNQQMPYAVQGGYPYSPYNPYGYIQQRGTSGLAIASLITGICGFFCVTPLVSIGLGIAALSDISKTGRPGKGMAIAGIILSGLWIALAVVLLTTGHAVFSTDTPQQPTQDPNGTSA